MLSNILAIVGLIILIVIVIWGLIHLASLSSGWFSSLFNKKPAANSAIQVTAPATAVSGSPTVVSWKYTPSVKGNYALMYQCAEGLQFASPGAEHTLNPIPCGAAFSLGAASTSIFVIPLVAGTSSIQTKVTVLYMPQTATPGTSVSPIAEGSATMTVHPGNRPAPGANPETPEKPVTPAKPAQPKPVPATPADLSVRIISSGVTDSVSGMVTVEFDIANIGGSSSGTYYFEAQLPTAQPYTYISPAQAPLTPGSHIVNTLRFTQAARGGGIFQVIVDPQNMVRESNESNNIATQQIALPYGNYNYQNAYPAQSYQFPPPQNYYGY